MTETTHGMAFVDCTLLRAVRSATPRVQCLTNSVAQSITANCLHAIGAAASMATHPSEIDAMSVSADAVLINLGTIDDARVAAVTGLLDRGALRDHMIVLDPVFVQVSPLRLDLARRVLGHPRLIVKGNPAELAALRPHAIAQSLATSVWITTGAVDRIARGDIAVEINGGHPFMAAVTGLGCALGAVVAAYAAVAPDPFEASRTAVGLFAAAGAAAGPLSTGPGSFAVAFLDALYQLASEA